MVEYTGPVKLDHLKTSVVLEEIWEILQVGNWICPSSTWQQNSGSTRWTTHLAMSMRIITSLVRKFRSTIHGKSEKSKAFQQESSQALCYPWDGLSFKSCHFPFKVSIVQLLSKLSAESKSIGFQTQWEKWAKSILSS